MHDFKYIYLKSCIYINNCLSKYFVRKEMHSTHLTVLKDPHNVPVSKSDCKHYKFCLQENSTGHLVSISKAVSKSNIV